jgi:O-antigen ligase
VILPALTIAFLLPFAAVGAFLLLIGISIWRNPDWGQLQNQDVTPIMLGWLLWPPITLFWSLSPGYSLGHVATLICLPLGWLAGLALVRKQRLVALLNWLPVLLLFFCFQAAWQGPNTFTAKPQGPLNDPNTFAALLNLLMLPLAARWLSEPRAARGPYLRWLSIAAIAAGLYIQFLISSRGAALALSLAAVLLVMKGYRLGIPKIRYLFLSFLCVASFITASLTTDGLNLAGRITETIHQGDSIRSMLYQSAWRMIQDTPWLGTGFGSFRLLYANYRNPGEFASGGGWVHCDYLQFWQEGGLPMLLLGLTLAIWLGRRILRNLQEHQGISLEQMGYLVAIAAVMLHAAFNFILYFAPVAMLLGIYLAYVTTHSSSLGPLKFIDINKNQRAIQWLSAAYALSLGFLLFGQSTVDIVEGNAQLLRRELASRNIYFPRYQVAYWLSILSPYNPIPVQTMGIELSYLKPTAGSDDPLQAEMIRRFEQAQQLIPCHQPYFNDALSALSNRKLSTNEHASAMRMVERSLACNPRHYLTYWYAGQLVDGQGQDAQAWWRKGIALGAPQAFHNLLYAGILSKSLPKHSQAITSLTDQMANTLLYLEANPSTQGDNIFWSGAFLKLRYWDSILKKSDTSQASRITYISSP